MIKGVLWVRVYFPGKPAHSLVPSNAVYLVYRPQSPYIIISRIKKSHEKCLIKVNVPKVGTLFALLTCTVYIVMFSICVWLRICSQILSIVIIMHDIRNCFNLTILIMYKYVAFSSKYLEQNFFISITLEFQNSFLYSLYI